MKQRRQQRGNWVKSKVTTPLSRKGRRRSSLFETLEFRRVLTAVAYLEHRVAGPELGESQEVQIADVDGDGDLDAVALSGRQLATLINGGDAVFGEPIFGEEMPGNIRAMALADFDGDGVVEVMSGGRVGSSNENRAETMVALHENDGAGNFTVATSLLTEADVGFIDDIEPGDFNGDGRLDAVAIDRSGKVVLLTNGVDGFTSVDISTTYDEPRAAHAVDLDNDGDLDLVIAASTTIGEGEEAIESHFIFVMTNDGGTFTESEIRTSTGAEPRFMSSADFDGNGFMDVVVPQQVGRAVTVFFNTNGVISVDDILVVDAEALNPERTGAFDVDADGNLDIVVTIEEFHNNNLRIFNAINNDDESGNFLAWYRGLGDGNFEAGQVINVVREASGLAFGDLDGDGNSDIMTTSQFAGQVQLHLNEGAGSYQYEELTSVPMFEPEAAIPADMDLDGDLDIVGMSDKYEISWYENDGAGNFNEEPHFVDQLIANVELDPPQLSYFWYDIQVADLDGDGDNDIITSSPLFPTVEVLLYENVGDGVFPEDNIRTISMEDFGALEIRLLDFDGDNDMDFVTAGIFDNTVSLYTRGDDGNYTAETLFQAPLGFADFEVGDLDGDGDFDIVLGIDGADTGSSVVVLQNFGDDGFDQTDTIISAQGVIADVGLADMDGDDDLDVVTAAYNYGGLQTSIRWFENTGQLEDAQFAEEGTDIGTQLLLKDLLTVDVDGDGDIDVLSADRAQYGFTAGTDEALGRVEWYENKGGGVFNGESNAFHSLTFDIGAYLGFGDINGDGINDITVPAGFDHEIQYYELIPLDFVEDNVLNIDDVQTLCGDIRSGTNMHDLNGDGIVNGDDMIVMMQAGFDSVVGDSNLDGAFSTKDLVAVFQAAEYEDGVALNSTWATGDWNCDGEFGSADLVYVFQLNTFDPNASVIAATIGNEMNHGNENVIAVDRGRIAGALDGNLVVRDGQVDRPSFDLSPQTVDRIFSDI